MPARTDGTGTHPLRALFILGVLVSLCVSDTVGPRLLPLPALAGHAAADRQAVGGADLTPLPSRGDSVVVRVVMAAPASKQVGREGHRLHVTARAPEGRIGNPGDLRLLIKDTSPPALASSAAVRRPPGRSPPLSA